MSPGFIPQNPQGNPYRTLRRPLVLLACAIAGLAASASVKADLIIEIQQSGSAVVATATGTIDLTGLSGPLADAAPATIIPGEAAILVGATGVNSFEYFTGISGPPAWATSAYNPATATSGTGDTSRVRRSNGRSLCSHWLHIWVLDLGNGDLVGCDFQLPRPDSRNVRVLVGLRGGRLDGSSRPLGERRSRTCNPLDRGDRKRRFHRPRPVRQKQEASEGGPAGSVGSGRVNGTRDRIAG